MCSSGVYLVSKLNIMPVFIGTLAFKLNTVLLALPIADVESKHMCVSDDTMF